MLDPDVLELAWSEQCVLLTADKDFGDLVFRRRERHCGVLLLHLNDGELEENAEMPDEVVGGEQKQISRTPFVRINEQQSHDDT